MKRYTTKQQILDDIDKAKAESLRLLADAAKIDEAAHALFRVDSMIEDAVMKREEAKRLRTRAAGLIEVRCRKLRDKLAEFDTLPFPFLEDASVDASLSERSRHERLAQSNPAP